MNALRRSQLLKKPAVTWIVPVLLATLPCSLLCGQAQLPKMISNLQPRVVKLFGAGGFRRLESYQTGMLISADGLIATVWSYVLDGETVTAVLNDGSRYEAKLVGYDAILQTALVKIDANQLPHFDLTQNTPTRTADPVLVFSNLFGIATGNEPCTVQQGFVSGRLSRSALENRVSNRGDHRQFPRNAIVVDAITNNPGAAGGAVTLASGELIGMIAKESTGHLDGVWINVVIPVNELSESVQRIKSGERRTAIRIDQPPSREPWSPKLAGFELVPDVLAKTPPFVDAVADGSRAQRSGLLADDLIIELNGIPVHSCRHFFEQLARCDRDDPLEVRVERDGEVLSFLLR